MNKSGGACALGVQQLRDQRFQFVKIDRLGNLTVATRLNPFRLKVRRIVRRNRDDGRRL